MSLFIICVVDKWQLCGSVTSCFILHCSAVVSMFLHYKNEQCQLQRDVRKPQCLKDLSKIFLLVGLRASNSQWFMFYGLLKTDLVVLPKTATNQECAFFLKTLFLALSVPGLKDFSLAAGNGQMSN